MDATNVLQERAHIQEHQPAIDTSQMSEQELQFHYFKMHDADNNNKLDGCELVKSLIHWHDQSNHDPRSGHAIPEPKIFKDDELINMIDPILQNDDKNRDGMIDYMEFSLAQANAAAKGNAAGAGAPH
ncbi:Multiple coagulation factor deficiency protein 2 [Orchesella cincta]|uniref:Multiple coagulation factor deficiency protein 2 n=1 Tax=Orchesella cincta TaxID=48709 RepID=A0A1D2MTQ2_ORCCI|nr:Multiple coagulation factor deficiency protein 2 [Orchesella cincta]